MEALDPYLHVRYKLHQNENWDAFLTAIGVKTCRKQAACKVQPMVQMQRNGYRWTIKEMFSFRDYKVTFKLGEEFEDETPACRKVRSSVRLQDNKLIQDLYDSPNKIIKTYEFTPDELKITWQVADIVSTSVYKPV